MSTATTQTTPEAAPTSRNKSTLSKTIPTDRISFSKQQDIIKAYVAAYEKNNNSAVSNQDVGVLVGMAAATVSQANAFLADVGIILRAESGKYIPSQDLLAFAKAHQFNADKAWAKLGPLMSKTWFGQEILARVKFRSIDEREAIAFLAEHSNAKKEHTDQLKLLIEYLALVGLISHEGELLKQATLVAIDTKPEQDKKHDDDSDDHETQKLETYTLTLDAKEGRRIIVKAPATIKTKELKRIQQWLGVQLIIEDAQDVAEG